MAYRCGKCNAHYMGPRHCTHCGGQNCMEDYDRVRVRELEVLNKALSDELASHSELTEFLSAGNPRHWRERPMIGHCSHEVAMEELSARAAHIAKLEAALREIGRECESDEWIPQVRIETILETVEKALGGETDKPVRPIDQKVADGIVSPEQAKIFKQDVALRRIASLWGSTETTLEDAVNIALQALEQS